eukprot:TRINITY_DN19774_c0_g1_i1.p1 TRINITY_DN19774_c0_g1~~TRINITY_DN19774_c0_g1_i1.p1  ORF type:complete len:411 (+),score=83.62 TRINITY_DN19774_c0_g1_i1:132-1235(+)
MGGLEVREWETRLATEKNAHRVTDQLYRKALEEVDRLNKELMRVNLVWNEEIRSEAHELRSCRIQVESLLREKEQLIHRLREVEGRARESESELVETHRRLTEAVVASTNIGTRLEEAEDTAGRLRRVNEQLEMDNARIRSTNAVEVENYRADLEAALDETTGLTARLKTSEAARLEQSRHMEEASKAELQAVAVQRTLEEKLLVADSVIAELHAAAAQQGVQATAATSDAVLRRLCVDVSTVDDEFSRLQCVSRESMAMVEELAQQNSVMAARLSTLTRCLLDIARSDAEIVRVFNTQAKEYYCQTATLDTLSAENERLSGMVQKAAAQMEHFNDAVTQAETREASRADATLLALHRPLASECDPG